jgi:GH43 family beta-xylosidase
MPRTSGSFANPVFPKNLPDPFVLRFNGRYYAYATGPAEDGRFFPMLTSVDLVRWKECGGALAPLDLPGAEEYWAPEVAYSEGRFYLYYATGRADDPDHHLRLATAEHPLGPWHDVGANLTRHEIFAIDAHPFRDPEDGQWYLFYARDELEPPYAGTGIVVDRLAAMDRLEGNPRQVLRPHADWQVYEFRRAVKGHRDWYTVEGPFVTLAGRRYVCFYSGGRWENPNYGVGYALADHPLGPWTDEAGRQGPTVLTTVPGRVIGPGHNSVVVGPDLLTQYLVYHGWDPACTARYPRIDRLDWADARPVCDGPSTDPLPAPSLPDIAAWFDEAGPGPERAAPGAFRRTDAGLRAGGTDAALPLIEPQDDFLAETSVRSREGGSPRGLRVGDLEVRVEADVLRAGSHTVPLPDGFRHDAWHTLLVGRRGDWVTATLDEYPTVQSPCAAGPLPVALHGQDGAEFAHFALSRLPREPA